MVSGWYVCLLFCMPRWSFSEICIFFWDLNYIIARSDIRETFWYCSKINQIFCSFFDLNKKHVLVVLVGWFGLSSHDVIFTQIYFWPTLKLKRHFTKSFRKWWIFILLPWLLFILWNQDQMSTSLIGNDFVDCRRHRLAWWLYQF